MRAKLNVVLLNNTVIKCSKYKLVLLSFAHVPLNFLLLSFQY